MSLPRRYKPKTVEPELQSRWQEAGVYHFDPEVQAPVYSIDTPPPTVSGNLHLGHVYSYSHTDFMARFWRMNGYNVFYPMGYDDNGLATARLVERQLGIRATEVGRSVFIEHCLAASEEAEKDYEALWQRLGLSIDWRYTYRTIDDLSRRTSQLSFLHLYESGLAYRQKAPTIWCPECRTAIAQAELNDLERESEFVTLSFGLDSGQTLPIATTRPELLPACVAVFIHPEDERYAHLAGQEVTVPLFGQRVPLMLDREADPAKGTGVVMCCTFGDVTDVSWWHTYGLPLVEAIDTHGRLTEVAEAFRGLSVPEARRGIVGALAANGELLEREPMSQSVRVHERCDTPVEYTVTHQWFVRVLEHKEALLEAGDRVIWHPPHMKARYRAWVENLHWDWCISRQRYFGVPVPVWYCRACGEPTVALESQLPVDPLQAEPTRPCPCGGDQFLPEQDVMDTWATSSLTPQIVGQWLADEALYEQVFPMSLRPQAHEIIRTWAFYTIAKSHFHFGVLPWREVAISGWGLAPEGTGKISKSRGGGPMPPMEMIERYSADAVRYWAASAGLGRDSIISEEKIQVGARLATKLWNVARFGEGFLAGYQVPDEMPPMSAADRWILSQLQRLVEEATVLWRGYDFSGAKGITERFFWGELADNYLEMAKQRLYDEGHPLRDGARYALYQTLLSTTKLLAPVLPHVTERIYQELNPGGSSIHRSEWPRPDARLVDPAAERLGRIMVEIATAVRRYKSEGNLSLSTPLAVVHLVTTDTGLAADLDRARIDLTSITRAERLVVGSEVERGLEQLEGDGEVEVYVAVAPS